MQLKLLQRVKHILHALLDALAWHILQIIYRAFIQSQRLKREGCGHMVEAIGTSRWGNEMRTLLFILILLMVWTSGYLYAAPESPVHAEVKPHNGAPALFIDGKPVYVTGFLAAVAAEDKIYKEMAGTGIHFYVDYVSLGNEAEGKHDFSVTDAYFARIKALDPDAYFIPRIGVTAPGWWQEKHKEECCKFASGALGPQSFASELWKKDMKEDVTEFIKHVRSSSYANRVLGFLVCSGYTAEWQSWGLWSRQLGDFSDPSAKGFRRWLANKYKSDEALQSAWKDSSVKIETAGIPDSKERIQSSMMNFRDPEKDGTKVTDFYLYYSDVTADAIAYFAGVVKEASDKSMLAGCFYGYMNQHGLFQQESGHNALSKVLSCPDIDFLASPSCYSVRGPGGISNFMTMAESVKLHGKLFFDESDIRTFLSRENDPFGRCKNAAETLAVLKREAGHVLSRGAYSWWFDMAGGWFSDKRILSLLTQLRKASEESMNSDRKGSAEIAVIFDDRSCSVMRPGQLAVHLMVESAVTWPRAGAPMDFYLLSDIAHPDMPKHKL
jgi:beta-galactosidase